MQLSKGLQKLLADFIFRDCRLASHPKLVFSQMRLASRDRSFNLKATLSKHQGQVEPPELYFAGGLAELAWNRKEAVVVPDVVQAAPHIYASEFLIGAGVKSLLSVPIQAGSETVGVLNVYSMEQGFFNKNDIGRIQLLFSVKGEGLDPETVNGEYVLGNFFQDLGVKPAIGRLIRPGDDATAVVSWSYWKSKFNLDPAILGKRIIVQDQAVTIVGVTPRAFFGF